MTLTSLEDVETYLEELYAIEKKKEGLALFIFVKFNRAYVHNHDNDFLQVLEFGNFSFMSPSSFVPFSLSHFLSVPILLFSFTLSVCLFSISLTILHGFIHLFAWNIQAQEESI